MESIFLGGYQMVYVDKSLVNGERIVRRAKPHWAMFMPAVTYGLIGLLMVLFSALLAQQSGEASKSVCSGLYFFVGAVVLLQAIIIYTTTEFAVTNYRVIAKTGLIRRASVELPLSKIESIQVKQGLSGRAFNYGTIIVAGTGGTKEAFPNIAYPMEFRKLINESIVGIPQAR